VIDSTTIRDATAGDLPRAAELGAQIVQMHHAVNQNRFFLPDRLEEGYVWWLQKELQRPEAVVLVAEQSGQIVGYAYGAIEERDWSVLLDQHGVVHDVFVVDSVRSTGVGRALMAELIARLEQLGAPRIVLSVMVQNESAQRLFMALGFRPTMLEMTRESG
jgi:ribosomal protein S18 acetylase RimI-like enzyme